MTTVELAKFAASLPLAVLLVLVLMGGYYEWWIYGSIHHKTIDTLQAQLTMALARADKWESRFLELSGKLDTVIRETQNVRKVVSGSPPLVDALQAKLQTLDEQLTAVHTDVKNLREKV